LARTKIHPAFWHYSRAGKQRAGFQNQQAANRRSLVQLNHPDIQEVLVTKEQIRDRISELAADIDSHYRDKDVLLIGILKGAVPFMADLSRAMQIPTKQDWMAVSSYGSGTVSSGVVRILKDLDTDVKDRNVLIVEDIIDSGLTLSWLTANLRARGAASVEIVALLRKPDAAKVQIAVRWVGFDIPNAFVVGYGLDYDERYRSLDGVGVLAPSVYS
jgi:hypoxanthine phosphoribosyltransferase